MQLLQIDDIVLDELEIRVKTLTKDSDRWAWSVERQQGISTQPFVAAAHEPAINNFVIACPDRATRDALMGALTSDLKRERRLRMQMDDLAETVVIGYATTVKADLIGETGLNVDMDAGDSVWVAETPVLTRKTFRNSRDQAMALTVPGNSRVSPMLRISPLAARTAPTANVGWSKRRRYTLTSTCDEPIVRRARRINLGPTNTLVSGGKARSDGNDVRVVIDGIERKRTLVNWNSGTDGFVWFIIDALQPGETMTVEVWYGNANAGSPPTLTYPDLPGYDLATSTNTSKVFKTDDVAANAAKGLWPLTKGTEGAAADVTVPESWQPIATLENPDSDDRTLQVRASEYVDGTTLYRATLDAWRGPPESTVVQSTNPYDGVGYYDPMGIVSVTCGFDWVNDGGYCTLVGVARDTSGEGWARFYTNAGASGTVASATRGPAAATKMVAFSVWPDDFVQLPPRDDTANTGPTPTNYGRARINTDTTVVVNDQITEQLGSVDSESWTPFVLGGSLNALFDGSAVQGVVNGASLTQWDDLSANARHGTQSSSSRRATYRTNQLNSLPGVDFDGSNDAYYSDLPANTRNETIVAVIRPDTSGNGTIVGSEGTDGRGFRRNSDGTFSVLKDGTVLATSTGTIANGAAGIAAVTITPTTIRFSINGTLEAAVANTTAFTTKSRDSMIGRNTVGVGGVATTVHEFDGHLFEIIAAAALSTADVEKAEGYLATKWGLLANLPIAHPYKAGVGSSVPSVTEADIYEIASEVRLGGSESRVAPYHTLLIGNARGESGHGTRRAACLLSETAIIDGTTRKHAIWTADLTRRVEALPTHAVRARVGWHDVDETAESPTSEWLPLVPGRPLFPNHDFDTGVGGWEVYTVDAGLTVTAPTHDPDVGGAEPGSLKIAITANTAASVTRARVIGPRYFRVGDRESVNLAAWMLTNNAGIEPRLFIVWQDDDGATLSIDEATDWTPVADNPVGRTMAARAPERATVYRLGVGAVVNAGVTGAVWFDDIIPNGNVLYFQDAAIGQVEVVTAINARVL